MSKLEELINKLCPNGVEFKKLSELMTPNPKSKIGAKKAEQMLKGEYPFYTSGKSVYYINEHMVDGENIFVNDGGQADIKYYDGKSSYADHVISFRPINVNGKYLYYVLMKKKEYINEKMFRGSGIKNINKNDFFNMLLPVPPLEVQCEIVRILDNFTLLSAELSAELSARQRQYDYYKQKVLDNIKTNNIKHITDIALVKARVGWQRLTRAEYLYEGNYFLITGTDFVADGSINFDTCVYISKDRYDMDQNIQVHKDDILITKDGTLGKVAILKDEPPKETTLNSGVFRISVLNKQEVYPQYLYHYFTSKYFKDFVESVKTGSTIPHLTQQGLVTLDIPIPELNEQVKISNLLDKFDKLCNDISEGLPAEIEARKKQYEYYRDKLLTFKELK